MKNLKQLGALFLSIILTLTLTISVPAFAAVDDTGYSDTDADAWYAEAVVYCRENNIMDGVGNNRFDPEGSLTRAALAAVLYRIAGTPSVTGADTFTDTDNGKWYSNAVLWASQRGLVGGYGSGLFGTNDPVSRQDMAVILWRYAGSPAAEVSMDFADKSAISGYAAPAVDWADVNNIVSAVSNDIFAPEDNATRAQIAAALMNYMRIADNEQSVPVPEHSDRPRILIAYFSATNNTENIANHLDAILDADLYQIMPERPYTSADLDYHTDCRASREQSDASARPVISGGLKDEDMAQYDIVFLDYPIWGGQAPKIISTFLESYDFTGKTIVPFCTSNSSGIGSSAANLRNLASAAAWMEGQRFSGSAPQSAVESWAGNLDIN